MNSKLSVRRHVFFFLLASVMTFFPPGAFAHHDDGDESHDTPLALRAHALSDVTQVFSDLLAVDGAPTSFRNDSVTLHDAAEAFHEEVEASPSTNVRAAFDRVRKAFEQVRSDLVSSSNGLRHDSALTDKWLAVEEAYLNLQTEVSHGGGVQPPGLSTWQASVNRWYLRYLGRPVDQAGLDWYGSFLQNGYRPIEVLAALLGGDEYFYREGGSNESFVAGLYADVFGTAPSYQWQVATLNYLAQYPASSARVQVARSVLYARYPEGLLPRE